MNKYEVAKYLRYHPLSIERLMRQNKIPCIKLETPQGLGKWFISSKDFHTFLFEHEEYSYKKLGFGSLKVKNLILE